MGNLNVRDVDVELIREMKANALDAGISLREWIIANLNIAVQLGGKFVKSSESTDLRAGFSSARLSGVNPHERGSLPVVQQEAAIVFKGVDKLQHDAVRLSAIAKVFDEPREMVEIGPDSPLHEVLTSKAQRVGTLTKIKGVKRASDLPPRNPKPAQDAFESPAVDREVIYEQD